MNKLNKPSNKPAEKALNDEWCEYIIAMREAGAKMEWGQWVGKDGKKLNPLKDGKNYNVFTRWNTYRAMTCLLERMGYVWERDENGKHNVFKYLN